MRKRKIDPTPFDRKREPPRQNPLIMPALWLWCWLATRSGKLRITKTGMEGGEAPFFGIGHPPCLYGLLRHTSVSLSPPGQLRL